jgi:peptidoglycan/xylan/chitin deacetylase (PgdA/CDA1 family)
MPEPLPIGLTFDLDAETLWLAREPSLAHDAVWVSQGRYGPKVGLPRILNLLADYEILATFFIPGLVIERYPASVQAILEKGHEVAHHSYSHRWVGSLSAADERDELERGIAAIEGATGSRPVGWRSPAAAFSEITLSLLEEYGFDYSSNMFDDDKPYLLTNGGRTTAIVELPFAWVLDDAAFWLYSNRIPGRSLAAPSAVLESWTLELQGLQREGGNTMVIAMHPQIIGRHSRLWVLRSFIEAALALGAVRFSRLDAMAEAARRSLLAK